VVVPSFAAAAMQAPPVTPVFVPPPMPPQALPFDTTLRVDPLRRPADPTQSPTAVLTPSPNDDATPLKTFARKALRIAGYAFAGYMALVLALIVVYRFVNPPMSSLMLQQRLTGQDILQDWVSLDDISPQIVRAVLVSEDGRFCQHHGIDLLAMQAAINRAVDGVPRGASTISMQVTKNLFLWPSKSYIRKAIEIPLTLAIELLWPKWRIMEVYLNIAEWGPGIFGVEAASRFHFDKAAKRLNEREAAQLAVALPNPFSRDPGEPGPGTRRLAGSVQGRMRGTSPTQTACVLRSKAAR
jgi:monofunctional glycosyltransferase